jgi:microsomal dipeptidase-like Zn-dependent dipeptidase
VTLSDIENLFTSRDCGKPVTLSMLCLTPTPRGYEGTRLEAIISGNWLRILRVALHD